MAKKLTGRKPAKEHIEQKAICQWLRWKRIGFFSVPNGAVIGGQNKWAMLQKLKNEGMRPGAPDLILTRLAPTGQPVAIEMKRTTDSRHRKAQREVGDEMLREGWVVILAKGYKDAIEQLEALFE